MTRNFLLSMEIPPMSTLVGKVVPSTSWRRRWIEECNGSSTFFTQMNCHLIIDLGGPTGSDNTFTGPLGKKLNSVEDLDYNSSFKVISGGPDIPFLPQDVIDDFSTDQQYGFKMVEAIKTGSVEANLFFFARQGVTHPKGSQQPIGFSRCGQVSMASREGT